MATKKRANVISANVLAKGSVALSKFRQINFNEITPL